MAEPASKQTESMEEILQSIKRIIEDDGAPAAAAAAPEGAGDVLDLTQTIKDDGTIAELPPLPVASKAELPAAPPLPPAPVAAAPAPVQAAPVAAPPPAPPVAPKPAPAAKPLILEEGLVSDQAAQAAAAALKPIVDNTAKDFSIPNIPSAALRNGHTVEDLVLEALKPMLKGWLDEHLPLIVQKIVEREVKRIVTFRQD